MTERERIAVLGAARTPIGKLGGSLSEVAAPALGAAAISAAVSRAGVAPADVGYVIMGNVLGAGVGQAPARQAGIGSGIPHTTSALTVNKVCASGMVAASLASSLIRSEDAGIVVAGGMESMSQAPHLLKGSRKGKRLGNWEMVDAMVHDGLWCCFNDCHMGHIAEQTAAKFEVTREEQDAFALASNRKASSVSQNGSSEIAPVVVKRRGGAVTVDRDEGPRADASLDQLAGLNPAFPPGETVTAGNSSQISDGAAALVLSNERRASDLGAEPMAFIEDHVLVATEPERLFEAPAEAIDKLLCRAGLTLDDIDLIEVNEAFSSQVVANGRVLGWDWDRVNVRGGAVALGHPIGASGARILVTLLYSLMEKGLKTGIAAVCHGGGGAAAMRVSIP